jgi:uncharacterized protein YndB with AHSA1/START domain
MTVTDVVKDPENRTMTITAEFGAPVERVWQIWADPRQLERWWGPPTYPATVVDHDLSVGGAVNYFMTSPEGDKYAGWWRVSAVVPPNRLEFEDGFADGEGRPNPDMPVTVICVTLADSDGGGTQMAITSTFATVEAMDQLLAMGMDEGMKAAMGQIDAILAV